MRSSKSLGPPAALLGLALLGGCAAAGLTPVTPNQSVARSSLRPEYRVFYDALKDFGDWVLIEPLGFVYRPNVSWSLWEPYRDGFWAPTDAYGWVWISNEPFGWATDHYGEWLYDRYQGWVWYPGLDWAPAWVSWQVAGDYAGWSPLPPRSAAARSALGSLGPAPASAAIYAPLSLLGATDLATRQVSPEQVGDAIREARPIKNFEERNGVVYNRGPALEMVERLSGPLARPRIDDLVPVTLGRRMIEAGSPAAGSGEGKGAGSAAGGASPGGSDDPVEIMRRAAERAVADVRRLTAVPSASLETIPMVRPILSRGAPDSDGASRPPESRGRGKLRHAAAPDSTR